MFAYAYPLFNSLVLLGVDELKHVGPNSTRYSMYLFHFSGSVFLEFFFLLNIAVLGVLCSVIAGAFGLYIFL